MKSATQAELADSAAVDARCAANLASYWAGVLMCEPDDMSPDMYQGLVGGLPPGVDGMAVPFKRTGPWHAPEPEPETPVQQGKAGVPITVCGVAYPSSAAAARAHNIAMATVKRRRENDWEGDEIFTTPPHQGTSHRIVKFLDGVTVNGEDFVSVHQAAKQFGVTPSTAYDRVANGAPLDVACTYDKRQFAAWQRRQAA